MSMSYYSINNIAFLVDKNIVRLMVENYKNGGCTVDELKTSGIYPEDVNIEDTDELLDVLETNDLVHFYNNEESLDVYKFNKKDRHFYFSDEYKNGIYAYEIYPKPRTVFEPQFDSPDDFINDVRKSFPALPKDFDILDHIVDFTAVCYG